MSLLSPVFFLAVAATNAPPEWRYDRSVDDMRVELRAVPGSAFDEIRVSAVRSESLQSLCDAVYGKGVGGKLEGKFKRREVLRETDTERWTYEQISVPVVSDRDYVMHVKIDQQSESCRITFETETDPAHPPVPGLVRIPSIRGSWDLAAVDGVVKITYQVYSDPGGNVPALFARGGQRDAALDFFKVILDRASSGAKPAR